MRATNLNPLPGKSGAIFDALESRFAKGHYKFGEILSPAALADEFGVSLQPLRVALSQLRALGFVIITPQVGCKVVSPTPDDIRDFFRLFGKMEGVMASLAAERHTASELKRLEAVNLELRNCKIPVKGLPEDYSYLVGVWHTTLRSMAHSSSLCERLKSIWTMSDFLLWQGAPSVPRESLQKANGQRAEIMEAVARRDSFHAEALMFEHVFSKPLRAGILDGK